MARQLLVDPTMRYAELKAAADEACVREMLGRWVSGLEPAVAYGPFGDIIGLTLADAPVGSYPPVCVRPATPAIDSGWRSAAATRLANLAGVDLDGGILPPDTTIGIDRTPSQWWKN